MQGERQRHDPAGGRREAAAGDPGARAASADDEREVEAVRDREAAGDDREGGQPGGVEGAGRSGDPASSRAPRLLEPHHGHARGGQALGEGGQVEHVKAPARTVPEQEHGLRVGGG